MHKLVNNAFAIDSVGVKLVRDYSGIIRQPVEITWLQDSAIGKGERIQKRCIGIGQIKVDPVIIVADGITAVMNRYMRRKKWTGL